MLVSGATIGPILLPIMLYHPIKLVGCTQTARFFGQRGEAEVLAVQS
jgi:hypothetical protein